MTPLGKLRATFFLLILLPVAGIITVAGCGSDPAADFVSSVPGIERGFARHLVSDDDSTIVRYSRTTGIYPFRDAGAAIIEALQASAPDSFNKTRDALLPHLERIAFVYFAEFYSRYFEYEVTFWSNVTPADAARLAQARSGLHETFSDTTLSAARKIERVESILAVYESTGYLPGIAGCWHEIGNLTAAIDKSQQLQYYHRALAHARRAQTFPLICQILGTLGYEAAIAGDADSMFYYWNQSLLVAEQHKLPDYAGRIYEFFAYHHRTAGRLALAHDLYRDAQAACHRFHGGYRELRFVVKLVEFYNELKCWEISGRLLQRAEVLEAQVPGRPGGDVYPPKLRAGVARARYLMATGRIDEAEAIFNEIKPFVRQQIQRDQYPRMLFTWGRDLLENGRGDAAAPLIDEGLVWTEKVNFPYLVPKFFMLRAQLDYERGDYDAATSALSSFEKTTSGFPARYRREWIASDVIRTRILLDRGDADSALVHLGTTLNRLETYLGELDASTHGYLWLEQCDGILDLLHDVTAGDAVASYGARLYWCDLYRLIGSGLVPASAERGEGLLTMFRRRGTASQRDLARSGRIHCTYYVAGGRLCRLTATPDGVRHDDLPTPVAEVHRLVTSAWNLMSVPPAGRDAALPRELVTPLRALALQLLPREVLDISPASPPQLLISAQGFLASLPFETLNISADGGYRPLLQDWDVAYVRLVGESRAPRRGARFELVVADPVLSPGTRRRLFVAQSLPGAARELAVVAGHLERPLELKGPDATKERVLAAWEDASLVYVAAHFLSNPEVPYLTLLPLSGAGADSPPEASLLDIGDVRKADFAACELVVLSGCATGAPYAEGRVTGPGFGDAFLDAGAGAVVQTFWAVPDDAAAATMSEFIRLCRKDGVPVPRAISRVRRGEMRGPDGIRHPYHWAAFCVKLAHLRP